MRYINLAVVMMLMSGLSAAAQADTLGAASMCDSMSIYGGQGVNHNLKELPEKIITGNLEWDKSYFVALGFSKTRGTLGESFDGGPNLPLASARQGYEVVLLQHHGLQSNEEIGAAYTLRTVDMQMGGLKVNFMTGAGLSYAIGTPAYEDGSTLDPGRHYRMQFLGLFELEWRLREFDNPAVITRVHHRSGVYGLIAPSHVGSNFLALGLRYKF